MLFNQRRFLVESAFSGLNAHAVRQLNSGQLDAAYHEKFARLALRVLGPEHPDTVTVRDNVGSSYQTAGRPNEVITLKEQILADSERNLGTDHPDTHVTHVTRNSLASSYQSVGRINDGIALQGKVLAAQERLFGSDDPGTVMSRSNLVTMLGRYDSDSTRRR